MYHGIRNMQRLLESWELPAGSPPEADGPGPDTATDGYLFDGSRRLALLLTGAAGNDELANSGSYADRELEPEEAEEVARALRIVADTPHLPAGGEDRDAAVERIVEEAVDEWRGSATFESDPPVRHQLVEDTAREAARRLLDRP